MIAKHIGILLKEAFPVSKQEKIKQNKITTTSFLLFHCFQHSVKEKNTPTLKYIIASQTPNTLNTCPCHPQTKGFCHHEGFDTDP